MPHIIIKTIRGKSQDQLEDAAKQAVIAVSKSLDKPLRSFSVSLEEYSRDEWEDVYNENIKDKDNVLIKPGYSCPKTFK
jgi:phenylpyruvate tautomerase PptA (4-oxalocrotonate tautomerase family)